MHQSLTHQLRAKNSLFILLIISTLFALSCSSQGENNVKSVSDRTLSAFGLNADIELPERSKVKVISSSPNYAQSLLQKKSLEIKLPSNVSLLISEVPSASLLGTKKCKERVGRVFIYNEQSSCIIKRTHSIINKEIYEVYAFFSISETQNVVKLSLRNKLDKTMIAGVLEEEQAQSLLKLMKTFKL